MVVAHPDDETLFAGGLLSSWPGRPLAIYCCSIPLREPLRAWKFFDVCRYCGHYGYLFPQGEGKGVVMDWLDYINLRQYTNIFTHNAEGEYGHPHHKAVHDYVMGRVGPRQNVYTFMSGELEVKFEWERKLRLLNRYNHASAVTGGPKYEELLARWSDKFDLTKEFYRKVQ